MPASGSSSLGLYQSIKTQAVWSDRTAASATTAVDRCTVTFLIRLHGPNDSVHRHHSTVRSRKLSWLQESRLITVSTYQENIAWITRNILDCDQSNVLLAHYFQFSAKFLKFCRRIWLTSLNNSALKTFARRKYLGYISDANRVIANFGSKFVAMATRVGRGRIWLTSLNSQTPKIPC